MNMKDDFWSQFETATEPYASAQAQDPKTVVKGAETSDFNWGEFESSEPSVGQKIASSEPVQFGLGVAKNLTYPADFLKLWATAEAMQGIEELEAQGIPVDREKYLKAVQEATQYIPTQELAEEGFEKLTGISLKQPEGSIGRDVGEYFSPRGIIKKGIEATVKKAGRNLTAAGLGAVTEKGLETAGVPTPLATLPASLITGKIQSGKITKPLSKEASELEKISSKHELPKMSGIFEDKVPESAILSKQSIQKAQEKLATSSKKAIENIVDNKIPLKKAIQQGHSPKSLYTSAYNMAYERAKEAKKPVDMNNYAGWIKNKIKQIESQVPSLSIGKEAQIKILKDEYKKLIEKNPKYTEKVSKILDEFGRPIRGPKEPKFQSKKITPSQVLEQNKHYNENLEKLYRKPEWLGSEDDVADIYREMKEQLQKSLDLSDNKGVGLPFRIANNIYSQDKKIERLNKIIKPGLDDPTKLKKILDSKKAGFLERDLGKDGLKSLEEISKYSQAAKEKIFAAVKQKANFFEELGTVGKATQFIAANMLGGEYVAQGLAGIVATKDAWGRFQGRMLIDPTIRKSYENWIKAMSTGKDAVIKRYASELDKNIAEVYGSFENSLSE